MSNLPLIGLFETMVRMRKFEEACLEGATKREIHGELHLGIGQEAIAAAMVPSLQPGDAVASTHRNHLHALAKGVDPTKLMAEIFERSTGLCGGRGGHMHPFDPTTNFSATGIVGSSIPIALGYAYAFAMERSGGVAVAVSGDGATNIGGFHESLNMAGAWKLPLVVLVENNEYAISVRATDILATPTIAERADAYGAWGRKVDGTDVEIVAEAFAQAVAHARSGAGPALLEASCHRFRGHYEGDADTYRPRELRQEMRRRFDPLEVARQKLLGAGISQDDLDSIVQGAEKEMKGMLGQVRADPMPDPGAALDHVFA
jgi:pyruvate dehydrogenase E1 component alpha subunit